MALVDFGSLRSGKPQRRRAFMAGSGGIDEDDTKDEGRGEESRAAHLAREDEEEDEE